MIRITKPRMMSWAAYAARVGKKSNAYRALIGKPEEKRQLERPKRRWEYNIKWILKK
jgi:hypothetical protein